MDFIWKHTRAELLWVILATIGGICAGYGYAHSTIYIGKVLEAAAGSWQEKAYACNVTTVDEILGVTVADEDGGSGLPALYTNQFDCQMDCFSNYDWKECWGCAPLTAASAAYSEYTDAGYFSDQTDGQGSGLEQGDATYWASVTTCHPTTAGPSGPSGPLGPLSNAMHRVPAGEEDTIATYCKAFAYIFLVMAAFGILEYYASAYAGAKITSKIRVEFYDILLRKSAGWQDKYSTVEFTEALAVDAAAARQVVCDSWPKIGHAVGILLGGIVIGFVYCWRMTLVILGLIPFLTIAATAENSAMLNNAADDLADDMRAAARSAGTIIENIQLITALGRGRDFHAQYANTLKKPEAQGAKDAKNAGWAAFSMQIAMFGIFSLAYWFGGQTLQKFKKGTDETWCDYSGMNIALMSVIFCGFQAGQAMAQIPDKNKALALVRHAFTMIYPDLPEDRDEQLGGDQVVFGNGKVEFEDVHFSYPTRPEAEVLAGVNVTIEAGQTVAFVGVSGCGKSTMLSLVQKLYAPGSGTIKIDGVDISTMSTSHLRSQIAVVPQEPKLFNLTVSENISYREASTNQQWATEAAGTANAASFITGLQNGYDYEVGPMGEKLSGGQCQRVAIARSLYGEQGAIKIMLLDEATSALDNESQRLVQEALDKAQADRTTIIVAHRLSTIQNCDQIFVFKDGVMAEKGTFVELREKRGGIFSEIYASQF